MVAAGLGSLLAVAQGAATPLDDVDLAYQRPGLLDLGELPLPAPPIVDGLPAQGLETVVFFVRQAGLEDLCDALAGVDLAGQPALIVVSAGAREACRADVTVVSDPGGRLAGAYGLRRPRGGGPPVGYAVVDEATRIRYRTLDPEVADRLGEVDTMLRAT